MRQRVQSPNRASGEMPKVARTEWAERRKEAVVVYEVPKPATARNLSQAPNVGG